MMDEEKRYREVEKRERLIQTFLIISGFLVAYSGEKFQSFILSLFSAYLFFTILYYVFLSRTKNYPIIDYFALISSYLFSFLIVTFISIQIGGLDNQKFGVLLIVLTLTFTFALLSPEGSEKFIKYLVSEEIYYSKRSKIFYLVSISTLTIMFALILYFKRPI
jgi:hypothetical protein